MKRPHYEAICKPDGTWEVRFVTAAGRRFCQAGKINHVPVEQTKLEAAEAAARTWIEGHKKAIADRAALAQEVKTFTVPA